MLNAFYLSNSNNLNFLKLLKLVVVFVMVLFVALMPVLKVYAMSIEATLIGALAGTLLATALGPIGVSAVVAILIGMGFSVTVSMLYDYFNNPDTVSEFMAAWDNFQYKSSIGMTPNGKVTMSGVAFLYLYSLVKNIIVGHFDTTVTPELNGNYPFLNATNVNFTLTNDHLANYYNPLTLGTDKWSYDSRLENSHEFVLTNSATGWESTFNLSTSGRYVSMIYSDEHYTIDFGSFYRPTEAYQTSYFATLFSPVVYNEELAIPFGWTYENGSLNAGNFLKTNIAYFALNIDDVPYQIALDRHNNITIYVNQVNHILAIELPDGTLKNTFTSYNNFLYYLLCVEGELIDTYSDTSINDSTLPTTTVNEYYNTSNDIYYNYYNTISAADTAGTLATGTDTDVKIETAALTSSIVGTETLTDVAAVSSVESAVQTTDGSSINLTPAVTCMTGINMVRAAGGSIRDKFPFSVVYVLRDSFKIFLAEPVTPEFSIPLRFNIGNLINIDEELQVDLSDLNTIASIVRWGETGALAITLAILTKQFLF